MLAAFRAVARAVKPMQIAKSALAPLPMYKPVTPAFQVITRNMAVTTRRRHRKILKLAKGFRGRGSKCYTIALPKVWKKLKRQFISRKLRKRDFRKLWIMRINASSRMYGLPYRFFVHGLTKSKIMLDRKVLADIAISEPLSFRSVIEVAKESLAAKDMWPLVEPKTITRVKYPRGAAAKGPNKKLKGYVKITE